jgi:hypothetical protein
LHEDESENSSRDHWNGACDCRAPYVHKSSLKSWSSLNAKWTHGVKAAQPCCNNLRQIEGAKDQWAIENQAKTGTPVTLENIMPYLKGTPRCNVTNGQYTVGKIGEEPGCTVHGTLSNFKPDCY